MRSRARAGHFRLVVGLAAARTRRVRSPGCLQLVSPCVGVVGGGTRTWDDCGTICCRCGFRWIWSSLASTWRCQISLTVHHFLLLSAVCLSLLCSALWSTPSTRSPLALGLHSLSVIARLRQSAIASAPSCHRSRSFTITLPRQSLTTALAFFDSSHVESPPSVVASRTVVAQSRSIPSPSRYGTRSRDSGSYLGTTAEPGLPPSPSSSRY